MTFTDALQPVLGFRFIGRTKDELWGKWIVDDGHTWTEQERQQWRQEQKHRRQRKLEFEAQRHHKSLSADERDRFYRQILNQLTLHPIDRNDLLRRGLTDTQIANWGIKSVEQWQQLNQEFPHTLPGISLDGHSLNTPFAGYLCPIRDAEERIVGFQIHSRVSQSDTPKYYWLTSKTKKRPNGATPHLPNGELPLTIYRPTQIGRQAIALVEGTGAKPFITAEHTGTVTIGAAGGQFASSPQTLKQMLEHATAGLEKPIIEFYPDAGAVCNLHVLRQYRATWKLLKTWGYEVQIMWWQQLTKADPDIDELPDLSIIQPLTISGFDAIAHQPQQILIQLTKLFGLGKGKRKKQHRQRSQRDTRNGSLQLATSSTLTILEYSSGDRLQTWQTAINQGYRYILDSSATGTGKSFDAGLLNFSQLENMKQIIYTSDQHRNPTVETLDTQNGWVDLEARHSGLTRELTVNGGSRLRRSNKGETPHIQSNCSRNRIVSALRSKYVSGADTATLICGTCPLREACAHSEGNGYGFLNQRHTVLASPKLRAHPDSLPNPIEYNYESVVLLWDEPGQTFQVKQDLYITLNDLEQVIIALLKFPALFEQVQPLLIALLPYLDGSIRLSKFGLNHAQVLAQLPVLSTIDIAAIESSLHPDLSFLNTTAPYGVDLADLPIQLRKKFSDCDGNIATQAEVHVVKQWLPELLRILTDQQQGTLSLQQGRLTIALPDIRHRTVAQAAKATIFLDATLSHQDLALKLGCTPNEILEVRQITPDSKNINIIQVTDLGRMGMQRGQQQQRRMSAIVEYYKQLDPNTKVIDFKQAQADGAWWRDSRGVNDFTQTNTLILVGTPCRNIADQLAEFTILTGIDDQQNEGFCEFVDRTIRADVHQAIGRLRSHRRLNESLQVIFLSNVELGIPVQSILASEITLEAATKRERFIKAALAALSHLQSTGQKQTQTAIAAMTGYSQQYLSRYWKLLLLLLEEMNSKSSNSNTDSTGVIRDMGQILGAIATELDAPELLIEMGEMLPWLTFYQWQQIWQLLSAPEQVKVLSALLMTIPANRLQPALAN